jgi:hypothetical protein
VAGERRPASLIRAEDGRPKGRCGRRRVGLSYDGRRRPVACRDRKEADFPYFYLGADHRAGPNHTRQPAVNSYYRPAPVDQVGPR